MRRIKCDRDRSFPSLCLILPVCRGGAIEGRHTGSELLQPRHALDLAYLNIYSLSFPHYLQPLN